MCNCAVKHLRNETVATQARLQSASSPHAAAWLAPLPGLGSSPVFFADSAFAALVRLRLGLPIAAAPAPCRLCCGKAVADEFGRHSLVCGGAGARHRVHRELRTAVYSLAARALAAPSLETPCFPTAPGLRPDVFCRAGPSHRPLAIDVGIVALTPALAAAAASPGGAAARYVTAKIARAAGYEFAPVVVDVLGAWGPSALHTLRRLAVAAGRLRDERPSRAIAVEMAALGSAVAASVASLLLANGAGDSTPLPPPDAAISEERALSTDGVFDIAAAFAGDLVSLPPVAAVPSPSPPPPASASPAPAALLGPAAVLPHLAAHSTASLPSVAAAAFSGDPRPPSDSTPPGSSPPSPPPAGA